MRTDPISEKVLSFLREKANEDGIAYNVGAPQIAESTTINRHTVAHSLQRLQKRDKIAMLQYGVYALVEKD
jgi:hypothetical protein